MTTLTRELLLSKAKPRFEYRDIPGVGRVGIRSVSELRKTQRESRSVDTNGNIKPGYVEKVRAWAFVDQLMVDEDTPMFSEDDVPAIQDMDHAITRPIYQAIKEFNGDDDPKKKGESSESSES